LFFAVIACEKFPVNPVEGRVFLRLDLLYRDKDLRGIGGYRTYLYSNPGVDFNPQQNESLGLGGLLVVHTAMDTFSAFDLACPNETTPSRNVVVDVVDDGMNAHCSKCGTTYQIIDGTGLAIEGKKHGLRSYNITVSGNSGVVTN
jgi:hypothetical protein